MAAGEGTFGGNGSVKWEITNVNDDIGKFQHDPPSGGNRGRRVVGVDTDFAQRFVVSIDPASNEDANALLARLRQDMRVVGNRVQFTHPVENTPEQIIIRWRR